MSEDRFRVAFFGAFICLFLSFGAIVFLFVLPEGTDSKDSIASTCAPVIDWLNEQYAKDQEYPAELPEEYQAILNRTDPPARYHTNDSGKGFYIIVGRYMKNGREVFYSTKHNRWRIND